MESYNGKINPSCTQPLVLQTVVLWTVPATACTRGLASSRSTCAQLSWKAEIIGPKSVQPDGLFIDINPRNTCINRVNNEAKNLMSPRTCGGSWSSLLLAIGWWSIFLAEKRLTKTCIMFKAQTPSALIINYTFSSVSPLSHTHTHTSARYTFATQVQEWKLPSHMFENARDWPFIAAT